MSTSPDTDSSQIDGGNAAVESPVPRNRTLGLRGFASVLILLCAAVGWNLSKYRQPSAATAEDYEFSAVIDADGLHCFGCEWNAGELDPTKTPSVTHKFTIHNQLEEEVEVEDVATTCGCLLVEEAPKIIPPGESVDIDLRYIVGVQPGPIERNVKVIFAQPIKETLLLKIFARVEPAPVLYSSPQSIDFGTLFPGDEKERVVVLHRHDGSSIDLEDKKVISDLEGITFEVIQKTSHPTQQLLIRVNTTHNRSESIHFDGSLRIITSHPTQSDLFIPIRAHFYGIDSYFVKFVSITAHHHRERECTIELCSRIASSSTIPQIKSIEFEGEHQIAVTALPLDETNTEPKAIIRWTEDIEMASKSITGDLKLSFSDHSLSEIVIPLVILVNE